MTLLRIDASIRGDESASAELADLVLAEWRVERPNEPVVRRHLGVDRISSDAWPIANTAKWLPAEERSKTQQAAVDLALTVAQELRDADAAVFAFPLYNWGVSQHVKIWVDMVIAGAAQSNERLLEGKPTVLLTTRGGAYGPGMPREGWDNNTPFLRRILADLWHADLTVVERELMFVGRIPDWDGFAELAEAEKKNAHEAALAAGRALALR